MIALTRNVHADLTYAVKKRTEEHLAGRSLSDAERLTLWRTLGEPGKPPEDRDEDPHA